MKKISILLVDDHELFRKGIKSLIENESDLEVIGMASNGKEALNKLEQISPDIILLDISMPVMTGIELAKKLKRSMCISKIIFLFEIIISPCKLIIDYCSEYIMKKL